MTALSLDKNSAKTAAPQPPLPSAFSLFGPSWKAIQVNLITFIEIIAIPLMISLVVAILGRSRHGVNLFAPISDVVALLFAPGLVITQLKSIQGQTIDLLPALSQGLAFFWRYLGLIVCMGLVIGVGLLLLIVPGLIMLRRYYLAPFYLVDRDTGVFEAMRMSAEDSKPVSGAVWGIIGVSLLFGLLSFILIGIVLSVMYYCAPALRYKEISRPKKAPHTA